MVEIIMFWLFVLLSTLFGLLVFQQKNRDKEDHKKLPPSPPKIPILGNIHYLFKRNPPYIEFTNLSEEFGPVFSFWFGSKLVVVVNDYDAVKKVLYLKEFSGRPQNLSASEYSRGFQGIISTTVCPALKKRVMVLRKFLRQYHDNYIKDVLESELSHLTKTIDQNFTFPNQTVLLNLKETVNLMMSNVTLQMLFGKRISNTDQKFIILTSMHDKLKEAIGLSNILDAFPFLRQLGFGTHFLKDYCTMRDDFIRNVLKEQQNHKHNLTEHLLNCDEQLSTDEIEVLLSDMLVAGIETISGTLQYMLLYLITNPSKADRCYLEVDKIVQDDDVLKFEDVGRFHYVHAFISETLRKSPAGPLATPHCTIQDAEISGFNIPKGTPIILNLYAVHYDDKLHDGPERFVPERFLDEHGQYKEISGFFPFSLGRRQCLGKQIAMNELIFIFVKLLQSFKFEDPRLEKLTDESNSYSILTPKDFHVKISRRYEGKISKTDCALS